MIIKNSTIEDLDAIFKLYRLGTELQRNLCLEVCWPEFDEGMVRREIMEKHQWKLMVEDEIACVWATTFSDPMIWEERNIDPAVYIHRIVTNPAYKGRNYVKDIVSWAKTYAKDKKYIRLDTCGNNTKLIEHYTNCGFQFLGIWKLKSSEGLPEHYQDAEVCFFEMEIF